MNTCRSSAGTPLGPFVLAIAGALAAPPVLASSFTAIAQTESEYNPIYGALDGASTSAFHINATDVGQAVASATGGPGGNVSVASQASISVSPETDPPSRVSESTGSEAQAYMSIDGLYLTGPGTTIFMNYQLQLTGHFDVGGTGGAGSINSSATISIDSSIGDLTGAYGIGLSGGLRQDFVEDRTGYSDTQQIGSGVFATSGFDGDAILTSAAGYLPLGVPLRINLSMSTSSSVAGTLDLTGSVSGQAAAIFDHTLSFPKDGPVFNLPEGYTANSLDGMIVDNRWTPVPIAPASVFLGTGLLSLLPGTRRRVQK